MAFLWTTKYRKKSKFAQGFSQATWNTNLKVVSIKMKFKIIVLDEITWIVSKGKEKNLRKSC